MKAKQLGLVKGVCAAFSFNFFGLEVQRAQAGWKYHVARRPTRVPSSQLT